MAGPPPHRTAGATVAAILLTRESGAAFAPARCLAAAGMRFHLLAADTAAAVRSMRGCAGTTRISGELFEDDRRLRDLLCSLLETHPQAVVVPVEMAATTRLARIAPGLPARRVFPLSPDPLLRELDDKWGFAILLERLGLPYPTTRLITDPTELRPLDVSFPAVVKPVGSEGSRGLQWVATPEALADAVDRVAAASLLPVLVQQHVEGQHVAVSGLAEHGAIRASLVHRPLSNGDFDFVESAEADDIARTVVGATGFHGVFNIDFQQEAGTGDLYVLEVNPRLYASVHKDAYAGVNLVELGIRLARGESFTAPVARQEVVQTMATRVRQLVTAKGRSELSQGSRLALRADVRDAVSTVVRAVEHRYRRAGGGQRRPWQKFDDDRRRHPGAAR